jgi:ABC-type polysaccharide/polyol phosphate export permease
MTIFIWILSIMFLSFFINLCSSRSLGAFKGDMAIMRSMGIPVDVIRISMYVRMLISLIPAFVFVSGAAIVIFTSPRLNEYFVYLYTWQYILIFMGMLALTLRITHKQIKRLFGESVKKSLKGGSAE